jgi:hypothetical protein
MRYAILVLLSIAIVGCAESDRKEYVECVSNVDHSVIRSQPADYWWFPDSNDIFTSPNGTTFSPRPGDSCTVYYKQQAQ